MLFLIRLAGTLLEIIINIFIEFISYLFSSKSTLKRKIKNTEARNIADIKVGEYVKIQGEAVAYNKKVYAPLSRKICLGYNVKVIDLLEEEGTITSIFDDSILNDSYIEEEHIQKFYLQQDNSQILILPHNATTDLKNENIGEYGLLQKPTPEMKSFLKRHDKRTKTLIGLNKNLTFYEGIISEGDQLTVIGKVTRLKNKNGKTLTVIRNLTKSPLYIKK